MNKKRMEYLSDIMAGILSHTECHALEAVAICILRQEKYRGNWALSVHGQRLGESAQLILHSSVCHFSDDKFKIMSDTREKASKVIREAAADFNSVDVDWIEYHQGMPTLSLEAENGRFYGLFFGKDPSFASAKPLYLALAKALTLLRPEDRILARSYAQILAQETELSPDLRLVDACIEKLFYEGKPEKFANWHDWYRQLSTEPKVLNKFFI